LLDLSRWQWAVAAAFHITFPALTVGTSAFLIICYAMYMRTDDESWLRMFRFWRRLMFSHRLTRPIAVGATVIVIGGASTALRGSATPRTFPRRSRIRRSSLTGSLWRQHRESSLRADWVRAYS
jgi:hypothetical protein